MAETTSIEWTATPAPDGTMIPGATFNPWWSCSKVSPACDSCYAATFAKRFGVEWGVEARRRFFEDKHWNEPLRWNKKAEQDGVRRKVFCASMADVFEILPVGHPDAQRQEEERFRLWELIDKTPHLDWLLLTKRPKNIQSRVPDPWWDCGFPQNVWLGVTVESQEWAEKRIPHLLKAKASVHFLSCEPLLGLLDLRKWLACYWWTDETGREFYPLIDGTNPPADSKWIHTRPRAAWVIAGGESGHSARPSHPDWFRSLRRQCEAAGVDFFHKQWGEWLHRSQLPAGWSMPIGSDGPTYRTHVWSETPNDFSVWLGKKNAGRLLDGRTWSEMPR